MCRSWRWQPYFAAAEAEEELPKPLQTLDSSAPWLRRHSEKLLVNLSPRGSPGERRGGGLTHGLGSSESDTTWAQDLSGLESELSL